MGLVCIFSNVCIIFLFVAQVACFASFQMFASFFWNFGWRALGPDWEFSGIPPAWVLLGGPYFFWDFGNTLNFGGPSFLGTTLEWIFLKVDPVNSIWVFLNFSFGFHGLMLNRTVDKIQNASRQRNFNLIFLLYKFFELLQLLFSTPV